MHTEGLFAPDAIATAREQYTAAEAAADAVLRALARELPLAADAGDVHADDDLRLTAQEAIFASLLEVHVGTRDEFEDWLAERDRDVEEVGSEQVSGVVWHDAAAADRVLAATYENEPEAAVGTLRRQAFAKLYRERL